jgi:hypothetical protein
VAGLTIAMVGIPQAAIGPIAAALSDYYLFMRKQARASGPLAAFPAVGRACCMNDKQTNKARSEQERMLDEALEETFPASDPISAQQVVTVGRAKGPVIDEPSRVKKS